MFDIGVNLTSPQFSRDRDEVVARAQAAGVTGMLFTGTNLHESEQARQLAHRYTRCWSTAGVHPHDSSSWTASVADSIFQLARQPEVVYRRMWAGLQPQLFNPQEQEPPSAHSWRWQPSCLCRFFCTAAMPMNVF
jgi:TatD DNase family protein